MSRNYQMHQMAKDEADRSDAIDRAVEAREAMHREIEVERKRKARLELLESVTRPLSACEERDAMKEGGA